MRISGAPPASYHEWSSLYQQEESERTSDPHSLLALYGNADLPIFGLQYGISAFHLGERNFDQSVVRGPPATNCLVCDGQFSATFTRTGIISPECSHMSSVCQECLIGWIRSQLENRGWDKIECPECNVLLAYQDIQRLSDPATLLRYVSSILSSQLCLTDDCLHSYEHLSLRSALGSIGEFVWCLNCDFGQMHSGGADDPIVQCENCGFQSCFLHSVTWHESLSCDEYDQMLEDPDGYREHEQERQELPEQLKRKQAEETLSRSTLRATTKRCPGCNISIERDEGCPHMTCKSLCIPPWPRQKLEL